MDTTEIYNILKSNDFKYTTDSRKVEKGSVFFALKGDNFDGNNFAQEAVKDGASLAIVEDEKLSGIENVVVVRSVLFTLQEIANLHRRQFDIPVIGITGSNGKTTCKELIAAVLKKKYKVLVTQGNYNNHLGVPYTLLDLRPEHEIAVVEMGANKPGDIKELVEIGEPTHAIITNIGAAHLEGFGSLEGVKKTKKEMYDFAEKNDKIILYNADDSMLQSILPEVKTYSFSKTERKDVMIKLVTVDPFVSFEWNCDNYFSNDIKTNLVGAYNLDNFGLACLAGVVFNIEPEKISEALSSYVPKNNRSQIKETERNVIIVDCYNANPTSMSAAVENFMEVDREQSDKVMILGSMKELGKESEKEHLKLILKSKEAHIDTIYVGQEFEPFSDKMNLSYFRNTDLVMDFLKANQSDFINKIILLKGSRSIGLEKLLEGDLL